MRGEERHASESGKDEQTTNEGKMGRRKVRIVGQRSEAAPCQAVRLTQYSSRVSGERTPPCDLVEHVIPPQPPRDLSSVRPRRRCGSSIGSSRSGSRSLSSCCRLKRRCLSSDASGGRGSTDLADGLRCSAWCNCGGTRKRSSRGGWPGNISAEALAQSPKSTSR